MEDFGILTDLTSSGPGYIARANEWVCSGRREEERHARIGRSIGETDIVWHSVDVEEIRAFRT